MQVNRIATPMAITLRSTTAADCQATAANPAPCPTGTPLPSQLPKDATLAWAVQLIAANNSLGSSQKLSNGGYLLRIDKATVDSLALKPTQLACVIAQELAQASLDNPQRFRTRSHELDGQAIHDSRIFFSRVHEDRCLSAWRISPVTMPISEAKASCALLRKSACSDSSKICSFDSTATSMARRFRRRSPASSVRPDRKNARWRAMIAA